MIPVIFKMFHSLEKEEKLTNSFHKANIRTLMQKKKNDCKNKEKNRSISCITIYAKILNKILANRIQKHTERITYCDQMEFILGVEIRFNIRKSANINHHNNSSK